jgi:hypothetical protein
MIEFVRNPEQKPTVKTKKNALSPIIKFNNEASKKSKK